MSTGALSSLGIGSNGTLSYDVIDQLREADENTIIKPIEQKLVNVNEKQAAIATLKADIAAFEDVIEELSDSTLFANREVKTTGDSVSVEAKAGVDVQEMDIEVMQLAKSEVEESNRTYNTLETKVATGNSTFTITAGGANFDFDVTNETSLEDLKNMINEKAGERVTASVLDTGGEYKLIVKADKSGEDNTISFSVGTPANFDLTFNEIQTARNSQFKYNGITVERDSNSIDDLITGATINLLKKNDPDESTNIKITQDLTGLTSKIEDFVEKYNTLATQLNDLTKYEPESGEAGLFLGESTINKLKSELSSILTYTTADNQSSFLNFGIELQQDGKITFDSEKLEEALEGDIDKMQQFFVGSYEEIYGEERLVDGVFTQFKDLIYEYTDFSIGYFKYFGDQLDNEAKSLTSERKSEMERLDQRYQIMAERFAAFDTQIAGMNSSFMSLQMQIEQSFK